MNTKRQNIMKGRPLWEVILFGVIAAITAVGLVAALTPIAFGHTNIGRLIGAERVAKSCPIDDPCQATKANWQSPQHMADRFKNGSADNAGGKMLPTSIQVMATTKWNATHKLPPPGVGKRFECGDHWWCRALTPNICGIGPYMCYDRGLTWGDAKVLVFRCGGSALLTGTTASIFTTPVGGLAGAGLGAEGCLYEQMGSIYGWW